MQSPEGTANVERNSFRFLAKCEDNGINSVLRRTLRFSWEGSNTPLDFTNFALEGVACAASFSTRFRKIPNSARPCGQTACGPIANFAAELFSHQTREIRMVVWKLLLWIDIESQCDSFRPISDERLEMREGTRHER